MARLPITTITKTSTSEVTLNYLTAVNGTPAADQFRSTITGRSKMIDFSTDMLPRMGVERIMTQQIVRVDGETGSGNQRVFKPVNDKFDQIRFVGVWNGVNDTFGQNIWNSGGVEPVGAYVEVTFYGTGLNLVSGYVDALDRSFLVTVDGVSSGTLTTLGSSIIGNRNYSPNIPISIVSGLTLGMHTVMLTVGSSVVTRVIAGFEILNESSSIKVGAGQVVANGVARTIAAHTSAYNSGFESGTLGTRGGRVVVYAKRDGTVGKAVTPTDAASLTMASASHANEEVIRTYHWREFGAGRTDDFSTMNGVAGAKVFTLNDGTAHLMAKDIQSQAASQEKIYNNSNGAFIAFTFIGTGLDFVRVDTSTGADTFTYAINGTLVTTITGGSASYVPKVEKVISGLPYGTHTFRMTRTSAVASWDIGITSFIVYGPKKPTIPAGAMELADYNIMANYAVGSVGINNNSTGVLFKAGTRETLHSGTWAIGGAPDISENFASGWNNTSTTTGSYAEYTFFGTGIELRTILVTGITNQSITIDGLALNVGSNIGSSSSLLAGTITGLTLSAAGVITGTSAGSTQLGVLYTVTNLPLGLHKIRVSINSGAVGFYTDSWNVITPIHTHKNNGPFVVNNTLAVGSQGINDGRALPSPLNQYLIRNSVATDDGAGTGLSTVSWFPGKATGTINIRPGKRLRVDVVTLIVPLNAGESGGLAFYLDGVRASYRESSQFRAYTGGASTVGQISQSETLNVSPGIHHVYVKLIVGGTLYNEGIKMYLTEVD